MCMCKSTMIDLLQLKDTILQLWMMPSCFNSPNNRQSQEHPKVQIAARHVTVVPVMPTKESFWIGGACLTKCEDHAETRTSSLFITLTDPPSFSFCPSVLLHVLYLSLYPPTLRPFTGDHSESSRGGIPGFIVLSDCLLPVSVRGVQPHIHTLTQIYKHSKI